MTVARRLADGYLLQDTWDTVAVEVFAAFSEYCRDSPKTALIFEGARDEKRLLYVSAQPELENERSALVKGSAPSGRGFSRYEEIYRIR